MKEQTEYNNKIAEYGCLFCDLLNIAEEAAGKTLYDKAVEEIYQEAVKKGFMNENCYITWKGHSGIPELALRKMGKKGKIRYTGGQYYPGAVPDRSSWGAEKGSFIVIQGKVPGAHSHFFRPSYNPYPSLAISRILSYRLYEYTVSGASG